MTNVYNLIKNVKAIEIYREDVHILYILFYICTMNSVGYYTVILFLLN